MQRLLKIVIMIFAVMLMMINGLNAEGAMMWKAEVNNKKIVLVGSIHMMKKEFYPLPELIETAALNSDKFIFETDLNSGGSAELMTFLMQNSMYQDGTTLDNVLADSTFALISQKMEELGLDMNKHLVYKPWYLALTYTMNRYRKQGYSEHLGIDRHFHDLAVEQGKEMGWLEEPLEQMKLLLSLSEIEPNQLITQTIKEHENYELNLDNLFQLWKTGNSAKLAELIFSSYEESPEVLDKLVLHRNREWKEKILEFAKDEKNYFIVVGAGHLVGSGSLIDLLDSNGIKFEQQ